AKSRLRLLRNRLRRDDRVRELTRSHFNTRILIPFSPTHATFHVKSLESRSIHRIEDSREYCRPFARARALSHRTHPRPQRRLAHGIYRARGRLPSLASQPQHTVVRESGARLRRDGDLGEGPAAQRALGEPGDRLV